MITGGMNPVSLARAQDETYRVCLSGSVVKIRRPLTSDSGGTPQTWDEKSFHAHPTRFAPFDRKVVGKVAWAESVSAIVYLSVKELALMTPALTPENLKSYSQIFINKKKYKLAYVDYFNSFGTGWLNVIVGAQLET